MLYENSNNLIDVFVAWVVSAKNALHTCYGYSPNQLFFEINPGFSSNLANKPLATGDITHNQLFLKHLNAKHATRKGL